MSDEIETSAGRIVYGTPIDFRLKRVLREAPSIEYLDTYELVLQGAYKWEALDKSAEGVEWRDIPTVTERDGCS